MSTRGKRVAYWTTTILIAFFIGSGGVAQLARVQGTVDGFVRILHYPLYFVTILGFWKLAGALAILVPRFPRLKEWAYAGIFFDLTGAAASSASVGGPAFHVVAPLVLVIVLVASWALRPESRYIGTLIPGKEGPAGVNTTAAKMA